MRSARPALPAGLGGQRIAIGRRRDCRRRGKCDATRGGRPDIARRSGGRWILDDRNQRWLAAGRSVVDPTVSAGWIRDHNHNHNHNRYLAAGRTDADRHPTPRRAADHHRTPGRGADHGHHDPTARLAFTYPDHNHDDDDDNDHHDNRHPALWVYFSRRVVGGDAQRVLRRIHGERGGVRLSRKRGGVWISGGGGHPDRRGVISLVPDWRSKGGPRGQPRHLLGRPKCGSRRQRVRWVGATAHTGRVRWERGQPAGDD
jgi:hypothetical protein